MYTPDSEDRDAVSESVNSMTIFSTRIAISFISIDVIIPAVGRLTLNTTL